MRTAPLPSALACLCAVLVAAAASAEEAAPPAPPTAALAEADAHLLADLGSDDAARRDAAAALLRGQPRDAAGWRPLVQAATALQQRDLLADAIRHQAWLPWGSGKVAFIPPKSGDEHHDPSKQPDTAALGALLLYLQPGEQAGLQAPACRVQATLAGFPAHALLRPGDLLLGVGGQPWPEAGAARGLAEALAGRRCGEVLALDVRRGKEQLQIPLTLGSGRALAWIWNFESAPSAGPPEMKAAYDTLAQGAGLAP